METERGYSWMNMLMSLSATAGSATVFNLLLAPPLVNEPYTRWDVCGAVLIAGGCVAVAAFGEQDPPHYKFQEQMDMFNRTNFIVFFFCEIFLITFSIASS